MKEIELGEKIVSWIKNKGWEVYQEVTIWGKIADIIAIKDEKIWIIECKTSLNFGLIEQADHWKNYAHYTSIAIPQSSKRIKGHNLAYNICMERGIGVLKLNYYKGIYNHEEHWSVMERSKPKLNERADHWTKTIKSKLLEEHKTYAKAGSPGNTKRFTLFKKTCMELTDVVRDNPGIELKEAIFKIKHHYKNDRSAIGSMLKYFKSKKKIIENIRMEIDGKKRKLYFTGSQK